MYKCLTERYNSRLQQCRKWYIQCFHVSVHHQLQPGFQLTPFKSSNVTEMLNLKKEFHQSFFKIKIVHPTQFSVYIQNCLLCMPSCRLCIWTWSTLSQQTWFNAYLSFVIGSWRCQYQSSDWLGRPPPKWPILLNQPTWRCSWLLQINLKEF